MTDESPVGDDDIRDALPDDLDITGFVGPYQFPDNSRRRIPAYIYLGVAALLFVLWLWRRSHDPVNVNDGFLLAAVLLAVFSVYSITSGWKLKVDDREALVIATRTVGFPVGHASAQMAWRGLRSRPTWRGLLYSAEEPPTRRGFVMVDGIDASILSTYV